jgi:hypothetical protein
VLDDEAEGNRDHRQVRPFTRSAGKASSTPSAPATTAASGQASQNESCALVVRMATVGTDGVEADMAEGDLAGQPDEHIEPMPTMATSAMPASTKT